MLFRSLGGWLVVIARNRAISQLRKRNPAAGDEIDENTVIVPVNLESAAAQRELFGRVQGALSALPQEQRALLELVNSIRSQGLLVPIAVRRTSGNTQRYQVIAGHRRLDTGDPLGTVKTRLRTAVETLRRSLQG